MLIRISLSWLVWLRDFSFWSMSAGSVMSCMETALLLPAFDVPRLLMMGTSVGANWLMRPDGIELPYRFWEDWIGGNSWLFIRYYFYCTVPNKAKPLQSSLSLLEYPQLSQCSPYSFSSHFPQIITIQSLMRQRRRRVGMEEQQSSSNRKEGSTEQPPPQRDPHGPMFMEEVDYKMEINVPEEEGKRVLLKNEEFTEQEKREAFKKKLRKYSGKEKAEDFQELP